MKFSRAGFCYATGLIAAFGGGWFLKPAPEPVSSPVAKAMRPGAPPPSPPASAKGTNSVRETGQAPWTDELSGEMAEVRAAMRPGAVNGVLLHKLSALLDIGEETVRTPRWHALLTAMRPEDAKAVGRLLMENGKDGRYWQNETNSFWRQWGAVDGAVAMQNFAAEGHPPSLLEQIMAGWSKDPAAALASIRQQPPNFNAKAAVAGLIKGAGDARAADAETLLLANRDDPLMEAVFHQVAWMKVYQEGITGAEPWFADVAAGDAPASYKRENLQSLVGIVAERADGAAAAALAMPYLSEPWLPADAGKYLGREWAASDPLSGLEKLEKITAPGARTEAAAQLLQRWAANDTQGLSVWLTKNQGHPLFDQAAMRSVQIVGGSNPEAARAWKEQIKDPLLKARAGRAEPDAAPSR